MATKLRHRPLWRLTVRVWKVFTVSTGVAAGVGTTYSLYKNDWNWSSIGPLRVARTALAVGKMSVDYKWTMWRHFGTDGYDDALSAAHTRGARRLLALACANGGVFIKVGQHLAALEYLLPTEYTSTMCVLHSRGPESTFEEICQVIKDDLKIQDVSECFSSIDREPIGAASLAQVYRATTVDGQEVALKVQHPHVKPHCMVDMLVMEMAVRVVARLFPEFKLEWLMDETKQNLPNELAFLHEGTNQDRVRRSFRHLKYLKVPEVYWEYSTDRILVMEYCEGGQVNDLAYILEHDINPQDVCTKLGQLYSEMIFVQGYVHCDPHPGNVLVKKAPDGSTQIVLLDHGLYTTLSEQFRLNYANFWLSLLQCDMDGMRLYAHKMGVGHLYGLFACMVTARSWKSISEGVDKRQMTKEESSEIQRYITSWIPQITDVLDRVPRPMVLIFKTNDLLRGIEYTLGNLSKTPLSLVQMSKYCVRTVYAQKLRECQSIVCVLRASVSLYCSLLKLWLYEAYIRTGNLFSRRPPPRTTIAPVKKLLPLAANLPAKPDDDQVLFQPRPAHTANAS